MTKKVTNYEHLFALQLVLVIKRTTKLMHAEHHTGWHKFWNDEALWLALGSVEFHNQALTILDKRKTNA